MLSTTDLRLLSVLGDDAASLADLAGKLDLDKSHVSRRVDSLATLGLADRQGGTGGTVTVTRRSSPATAAYDQATDALGHLDLPELCSPSTLEVLWSVTEPRPVRRITPHLLLSRVRIHQILTELRGRQIVTKDGTAYRLKPTYEPLGTFASALVGQVQEVAVRNALPGATVVWTGPYEALVVPGEDVTEERFGDLLAASSVPAGLKRPGSGVDATTWRLTGLRGFRAEDLEFRTAGQPLLYAAAPALEPELATEERIVHALVRRIDDRRVNYSVLAVLAAATDETLDSDRLLSLGEEYGVGDAVQDLLSFVATGGESRPASDRDHQFPTWERVVENAARYDVPVDAGVDSVRSSLPFDARSPDAGGEQS